MNPKILLLVIGLVALVISFSQAQTPTWQQAVAPTFERGNVSTGSTPLGYMRAVATDASGNVYVAGSFTGKLTFKAGLVLETAAGASGAMYVAKWNTAAQSWDWALRNGGTTNTIAYAIAVANNRVYVTGYFNNAATIGSTSLTAGGSDDYNMFLAMFNAADGSVGWAVSGGSDHILYNGTTTSAGSSTDAGLAIAVEGTSVYVGGYFSNTASIAGKTLVAAGTAPNVNSSNDLFVAKYIDQGTSAQGVWAVGAGSTGTDRIQGLDVSGSDVYVSGYYVNSSSTTGQLTIGNTLPGTGNSNDAFVAKFTDAGTTANGAWATSINNTAGQDQAMGITVSGSNVYVTGFFYGASATLTGTGSTSKSLSGGFSTGTNAFLARYTPTGNIAWATTNTANGGTSQGLGVATDGSNGVYITGNYTNSMTIAGTSLTGTGLDIFVAKYIDNTTSAGNGWALSGGSANSDLGAGIALAGSSAWVGGYIQGASTFGSLNAGANTSPQQLQFPLLLKGGPSGNAAPTISNFTATPDPVCTGSTGTFTATIGNVTGNYSYTLTNGTSLTTGTTSTTAFSQNLTAAGSGTQSFTLTIANNSQSASATTSVTVSTPSSATIAYTNSPFCANDAAGTVTRTGTAGGTYSATPTGLSINSSTGQITPSSSTPGTYTVTYTMAANGACGQTTATTSVTITAPASATISYPGSPFVTSTASVSVSRTGTAGGTYSASSADLSLNTSTGQITPSSSTPGTYTVTYSLAATGGCPSFSASTILTIQNPQADLAITITDGQTSAVAGSSISYTITVSNAGPANASGATVACSFPVNLTGIIWHASGAGGGIVTAAGSGNINESVTLPSGGSVTFTATGTISLTATGTLSTTATVAAPAGLTDPTSGNNRATDTDVITTPSPTLTGFAALNSSVCVGNPITLTATLGNVSGSYAFTLTNGSSTTTGTSSSPSFSQNLIAAGSGAQSFTLTVLANSQSTTASTGVTVNSLPVAGLVSSGTLTCAVTAITLTASGGTSYTFANGSGTLGTPGSASTLSVNSPGTYSVTVGSSSGCTATTSVSVSANQTPPSISITPSSATLTNASPTVSLTAVGTGTYHWSTGATTQVISVTTSGTYSVTLTSPTGCTASANVPVVGSDLTITLDLPQANFAASGTAAVGNFVVNVFEVAGLPTSSGNVTITITAPVGYTLSFAPTLTSITVSGGSSIPVSNSLWTVTQNLTNRQLTLTMTSGAFISGGGESSLGFSLTRTTATSGSTSNITVNVVDDLTVSYDGNLANNVYARIISGL